MDVGCSDYLTKPVRKNTLLQTIYTHLHIQSDAKPADNNQDTPPMEADTQEHPHVILDAKIRKLIPRFLENKKADIVRMQETLEAGKYEELKKQAHTVKGTSWMYGFKFLGDNCLKLEKAATAGNRKLAEQLITEVGRYLDTVVIGYKAADSKNESKE
jgi:HPt (histidine-containing phosphotransfer) domain-containing protein